MVSTHHAEPALTTSREAHARWLVTGGAGFIGSHLVAALLGQGHHVTVFDDFSFGREQNLEAARLAAGQQAATRLAVVREDIRDASAVAAATATADYVLHHAARGSVPESLDEPALYHAVNVDGTFNVFNAARHARVRGLVYATSAAVYGDDATQPKVESLTGTVLSPYALGKRINEQYASLMAGAYGLPVVGLRYFNVVGARQDPAGQYA
ncbi:MAG: NAD-dependent epimerase/dehydratase family protein, partial [Nannocystaceae bacterium]|nr:NAD-dependent epimerase/dehydratase family protein [Nannocystaceae bacterium]